MKKNISDFPTPHIYNSVVQQERKKIVSPQQISLCVFTNYCFELIFFCVALYLVDGSIAVHLTFALNGFFLSVYPLCDVKHPQRHISSAFLFRTA